MIFIDGYKGVAFECSHGGFSFVAKSAGSNRINNAKGIFQ